MYALIIAGGKGERLRPVTDSIPKPMIPVAGKPILEHQINWLKHAGVTDIVLLVGHLAKSIEEHFNDGSEFGINLYYSREDTPLGRGGAIKRGLEFVESEDAVFVINGDIICDHKAIDVLDEFNEQRRLVPQHMATLMVVPMVSPYGIVYFDDANKVRDFKEKDVLPYWINGGVYVFSTNIRKYLPDVGDHEVEAFPRLASDGQIGIVKSNKFWRSVDSFKDLSEVEHHLTHRGGIT